jgi:hypothetical protein
MSNTLDQFSMLSSDNVESSLTLAALSVGGSARVLERQLDFAKEVLQDRGASAVRLLLLEDSADEGEIAASSHRHLQRLLDLSKDCFEIALHTQREIARAVSSKSETVIQRFARAFDHMTELAVASIIEAPGAGMPAATGKQRAKAANR